MSETAIARRAPVARLTRLLSCVRWDEAIVLQGAPLIGASFSIGALTVHNVLVLAVLAVASCCLVAHVYTLNDWSGITGDLRDPNRAPRTFATKGASRTEIGVIAMLFLAASLLLLALLDRTAFVLAVAIAGLGALYSAPMFLMKGRPVFNSLLHFAGGTLHFLLGYATFAVIDARAVAIGCFFGLVFAAGHLNHETRDCDADQVNGIRTNAVAFGKARSFAASFALFTAAYALLPTLALLDIVPRLLVLVALLYPVQLFASWRALRAGLSFESLSRLQRWYRVLYAMIGLMMMIAPRLS